MSLTSLFKQADHALRKNSPAIFTGLGVAGTFITSYLTAKATFKAARVIPKEEIGKKEAAKLVWKLYIPPAISCGMTMTFIIAGAKIGSRRTAAAYSLLTVSEKAFSEYKEKVIEQYGEKKEQKIRDEIAQDKVNSNQPLFITGSGTVLCYELHTGRYFNSDMETIKKAQNVVNAKMIREMEATLNDFYYLVGLPQTSYSGEIGWDSGRMMELKFSAVIAEDGKPCIAFEYNYLKNLV